MTNQQHPIIPPPELVEQWYASADNASEDAILGVSNRAAQWGADQELDACCEWLAADHTPVLGQRLRAARRPKPPSLKEQALANTNAILNDPNRALLTEVRAALELNRRALEALND